MRYETRLRIERRRLAISERWWQFKLWLILRMATYVETGDPVHPKDWERMRDEYLRLVGWDSAT